MFNSVYNVLKFNGNYRACKRMLEEIKDTKYGVGTIDFAQITYRSAGTDSFSDVSNNNIIKPVYSENINYYDLGCMVFETLYQPVSDLISKLSKLYPDIKFEYEWVSKSNDSIFGRLKYNHGREISDKCYNYDTIYNSVIQTFYKTINKVA